MRRAAQAAPSRGPGRWTGRALRHLRDRALRATETCFTISDPHQPDNPLVYVNPAFSRTTGYAVEDCLGRNCRFLQGPGTDPAAVALIRAALDEKRSCLVTLLNYRADGTPFWNEVAISPVLDAQDRVTHFVGVQTDVTARVQVELERERLLAAERSARAAAEAAQERAEHAQRRLALLAEATTLLSVSLDLSVAVERLAALLVPALGDGCVVELAPDGRSPGQVVARHVDPDREQALGALARRGTGSGVVGWPGGGRRWRGRPRRVVPPRPPRSGRWPSGWLPGRWRWCR